MKQFSFKKIYVAILILTLTFSLTACEGVQMEAFMNVLAGFTGNSGIAHNQPANGAGGYYQMVGGQMRNMWMSQSQNSSSGRELTNDLQYNQSSSDYGVSRIDNSSSSAANSADNQNHLSSSITLLQQRAKTNPSSAVDSK